VGLAIGCTQTHAKGHAKETLGDKFQNTRTAQLGNTIKVRWKEKYEVLHDVTLVVLVFGLCEAMSVLLYGETQQRTRLNNKSVNM
jgi:hypothetical protein